VDKQSAADTGRPVVAAADDDAESDDESETQSAAMPSPLYALILTPTRELAMQTRDHIHQLTSYADITVCLLACLSVSVSVSLLAFPSVCLPDILLVCVPILFKAKVKHWSFI